MPDTPHPPFAPPALLIPRQLNRWLDINPQGGPLNRVELFITLPAFQVTTETLDSSWSDIFAVVPFNSPNRFSLRQFTPPDPSTIYYTLCIMWVKDGVVSRYVLFHCDSEAFYFNIPDYAGQVVEKNFRFEIWSTYLYYQNIAAFQFYTTVLGDLDYRYGVDGPLCNAIAEYQDMQVYPLYPHSPYNGYALPINFPSDSVPQSN